MYIKAFFEQDFQPVLKKVREIETLLAGSQDEAADYRKATRFYKKMLDLEEQKKRIHSERIVSEEKKGSLQKRLSGISGIDPGSVDESSLGDARRRAASLRQEIDSFLSLQKLFKKYQHDHDVKDSLLEEYIKSPSNALLMDESLKILDFTRDAFSKCPDSLPEKKVSTVLEGSIYLRVVKEDLEQALEVLKREEEQIRQQKSSVESAASARQLEIKNLEAQIKNCDKTMDEAHEKYGKYNSEISKIRADLCMLASGLVGGTVS
jgi:hypothetical protein